MLQLFLIVTFTTFTFIYDVLYLLIYSDHYKSWMENGRSNHAHGQFTIFSQQPERVLR